MFQVNELNREAMTIRLEGPLPDYPAFAEGIRRAPDRGWTLNRAETELAVKNALRYVPEEYHEALLPEFLEELRTRGRIYAYRFRPEGRIRGLSVNQYQGKCLAGKAFQVMIDNNLDFDIALYPYELVTYGETGQCARTGSSTASSKNTWRSSPRTPPSCSRADTPSVCSNRGPTRPG